MHLDYSMESYIKFIAKSKKQFMKRNRRSSAPDVANKQARTVIVDCHENHESDQSSASQFTPLIPPLKMIANKIKSESVSKITSACKIKSNPKGVGSDECQTFKSLSKGTSTDSGNHSIDNVDDLSCSSCLTCQALGIQQSQSSLASSTIPRESKISINYTSNKNNTIKSGTRNNNISQVDKRTIKTETDPSGDHNQHCDELTNVFRDDTKADQQPTILRPSSKFDLNNNNKTNIVNENNINHENGRSTPSPLLSFTDQSNWLLSDSCSRLAAEQMLKGHVTGTFLVRPSTTKQNSYALSVVVNDDVCHCLIDCLNPDGAYCFHPISAQHKIYATLMDLIMDYRVNSMYKHHRKLDTNLAHPVGVAPFEQL